MRCAVKILILPLLCQALFAIGLSFEPFEKANIYIGSSLPPIAKGAMDFQPPFLFPALTEEFEGYTFEPPVEDNLVPGNEHEPDDDSSPSQEEDY